MVLHEFVCMVLYLCVLKSLFLEEGNVDFMLREVSFNLLCIISFFYFVSCKCDEINNTKVSSSIFLDLKYIDWLLRVFHVINEKYIIIFITHTLKKYFVNIKF